MKGRNGHSLLKLKPCASRVSIGSEGKYQCAHPQVHAEENLVSSEVCRRCSYHHAAAGRWRIDADGVASPCDGNGTAWNWAVGITTAPRKLATLEECVISLRHAGWDTPRIFAEPGVEPPRSLERLILTSRDARLGAFPNWYLALAELVMRHPQADAYLMVQDDAVFARSLRGYLESILWPGTAVGVVSLYCPSHYSEGRAAGLHATNYGWLSWGALAYAFPNFAARRFLAHPPVLEHRRQGPHDGLRNVDSVVGAWCSQSGLPYYVHVPSLVQHIGDTSTIYPDAVAAGKRIASDFISDVKQLKNETATRRTPIEGPRE